MALPFSRTKPSRRAEITHLCRNFWCASSDQSWKLGKALSSAGRETGLLTQDLKMKDSARSTRNRTCLWLDSSKESLKAWSWVGRRLCARKCGLGREKKAAHFAYGTYSESNRQSLVDRTDRHLRARNFQLNLSSCINIFIQSLSLSGCFPLYLLLPPSLSLIYSSSVILSFGVCQNQNLVCA